MTKLSSSPVQNFLVVLLSILFASIVNIYPMSLEASRLRPMALMMVLIFWLIHQPKYISVGVAFTVGIIADLLLDTRLGQQGFAAVVMALAIRFVGIYLRELHLPVTWMVATGALIVYQVTLWTIQYITQNILIANGFFSLLISIATWPIVYLLLIRMTRP